MNLRPEFFSFHSDDVLEPYSGENMWSNNLPFSFLYFLLPLILPSFSLFPHCLTSLLPISPIPVVFLLPFPPFLPISVRCGSRQKSSMFVTTGALSISTQKDWQPAVSAEKGFHSFPPTAPLLPSPTLASPRRTLHNQCARKGLKACTKTVWYQSIVEYLFGIVRK